jgi:hypothetical protein
MTIIEQRIAACIARHPDWDATRVTNSIAGAHVAQVRAIMSGAAPGPGETIYPGHPKADIEPAAIAPVKSVPLSGFVTLDKIRARYDTRESILRELGKIPRGKLISENDLAQRAAGKDRSRFRRTVENNADDFEPHRVKLRLDDSADGKFYWGGRDDIAEAKRICDL